MGTSVFAQTTPVHASDCDTNTPYQDVVKCTSLAVTSYLEQYLSPNFYDDLENSNIFFCMLKISPRGTVLQTEIWGLPSDEHRDKVIRLIKNYPFIPATLNGENCTGNMGISVYLNKPVSSNIDENPTNTTYRRYGISHLAYPDSCASVTEYFDQKECTAQYIRNYVASTFNTNIARDLEITGRINFSVDFKINKTGSISDISVTAPHPILEQELTSIIENIPAFNPAIIQGRPVNTPYSLPVALIIK